MLLTHFMSLSHVKWSYSAERNKNDRGNASFKNIFLLKKPNNGLHSIHMCDISGMRSIIGDR